MNELYAKKINTKTKLRRIFSPSSSISSHFQSQIIAKEEKIWEERFESEK